MIRPVLEMEGIRSPKAVDPGARAFPDGDRRRRCSGRSEGQIHLGQSLLLQTAGTLQEKFPRWRRHTMRVRRPLLQLGHDPPVGRAFTSADLDTSLLSLPDTPLGAALVESTPDRRLTSLSGNDVGAVVRGALKARRRRKLSSGLELHPAKPAIHRPLPHGGCESVGGGNVSSKWSGSITERK